MFEMRKFFFYYLSNFIVYKNLIEERLQIERSKWKMKEDGK